MKTVATTLCVLGVFNLITFGETTPGKKESGSFAYLTSPVQYEQEVAQGDLADLFGANSHKNIPSDYFDFGRRFVPQYLYVEKSPAQVDEEAENKFDEAVKEAIKRVAKEEESLRPIRAPPEIVLAVARQSALLEKSKPLVRHDQLFNKDILRTGQYWNAFWKEDIPDPSSAPLRSGKRVESVRIRVMPGSKLYKLLSMTNEMSPRYLYVINNNNKK